MTDFETTIRDAYTFEEPALRLGKAVHDGSLTEAEIGVPLSMLNRHGLIAGATGTGKTVTLRVIAEQLSEAGVPVFMADIKGDLAALAEPGAADGPAPERAAELGFDYEPTTFPVEFLSLGGIGPGVPVRVTVSDFGPMLLAKILGANQTQEDSLALVFRYADQHGLPLLDLSDLRALLTFLESDEGKPELDGIGGLASATVGVLLRSLAKLEDGGGNELFGEPMFEVEDLLRVADDGRGVISVLELAAAQDKPALFSTALMWLLGELFEDLPELGDVEKPELVFFFDEAHLLFDGATDAFLDAVANTVRLIRSKGVGVFFVTQQPTDVHEEVLSQLGNRVQHALRAFTPKDQKAIKLISQTFPTSEFYDVEELITSTGIGEAAVTILSEKGAPSPLVHARLAPPSSLLGPGGDVDAIARSSPLWAEYGERIEAESAREILAGRLQSPADEEAGVGEEDEPADAEKGGKRGKGKGRKRRSERAKKEPTEQQREASLATGKGAQAVGKFLSSSQGKSITSSVGRSLLGMLKK